MLDLVVIHPGAAHGIYGSELARSLIAVEPPLWARLIAAYARDRGYSVKIIDAEADALSPDDVATCIEHLDPRLVCVAVYGHQPSASTQQMDAAIKIVDLIAIRGRKTVMVGGHVAALTEGTMNECRTTWACHGEGPQTVTGLLEYLKGDRELKDVPDLAYRVEGRGLLHCVINKPANYTPMGDLNGDAWDLLPMEKYRAHNWQCFGDMSKRAPYASIHTSLGCPYKCSFCCINAPFGNNVYRMRTASAVLADIKFLYHNYNVETFKIVDEMFVLNERHYLEICNGLIEFQERYRIKLNLWAYARVDTIKKEYLHMLRRAGFKWLAIGIESASEHVRDGANKKLRANDIEQIVADVRAEGINVIANYIFGLPDDDMTTMQETLDLALRLNTEFANFYSAMAYPGSELYWEALDGDVLPDSWRGYSQHNADCKPLPTQHVSAADVLRFRDAAFMRYFTNPDYLSMIERKFGPEAVEHVRQMTTITLPRKLLGDATTQETAMDLEALHKRLTKLEGDLTDIKSTISTGVQSTPVGASVHNSFASTIAEITDTVTKASASVASIATTVNSFGTRLTALEQALGIQHDAAAAGTTTADPTAPAGETTAADPAETADMGTAQGDAGAAPAPATKKKGAKA